MIYDILSFIHNDEDEPGEWIFNEYYMEDEMERDIDESDNPEETREYWAIWALGLDYLSGNTPDIRFVDKDELEEIKEEQEESLETWNPWHYDKFKISDNLFVVKFK